MEPVRIEDEDLRDYARHLKEHLRRGQPWEQRVYDFYGERRGEVDAVDLKITLDRKSLPSGYVLEMYRGRREGLPAHE